MSVQSYEIKNEFQNANQMPTIISMKVPSDLISKIDSANCLISIQFNSESTGVLCIDGISFEVNLSNDSSKEFYTICYPELIDNSKRSLNLFGIGNMKLSIGSCLESFDNASLMMKQKTQEAHIEYKKRKTISIHYEDLKKQKINDNFHSKTPIKSVAVTPMVNTKIKLNLESKWVVLKSISAEVVYDDIILFFTGISVISSTVHAVFVDDDKTDRICDIYMMLETENGYSLAFDLISESFRSSKNKNIILSDNLLIEPVGISEASIACVIGVQLSNDNLSADCIYKSIEIPSINNKILSFQYFKNKYEHLLSSKDFSIVPEMVITSANSAELQNQKKYNVYKAFNGTDLLTFPLTFNSTPDIHVEILSIIRNLEHHYMLHALRLRPDDNLYEHRRLYIEKLSNFFKLIYDRLFSYSNSSARSTI